MAEKKKKVDTSAPAEPLTHSPFAALMGEEAAVQTAVPVTAAKATPVGETTPKLRIARTKKGGYPVSIERRSAGKTVTIVRNVSGDLDVLLTVLKKHCAAGGKAFEESVEIQGDHCAKISAFFEKEGF